MAAVCLWLIENKSIQMFRFVLCLLWRYFHVRRHQTPKLRGSKGTAAQSKQKIQQM